MAGLTYANQVGAALGLNQAAPGTFIPEDFVRWSQDILFDKAGLLRRRRPFETLKLFNAGGDTITQPSIAGERILGITTTINFDNKPVIGLVVAKDDGVSSYTKIYFYDDRFQLKSTTLLDTFSSQAIFSSKSDINSGIWLSFLDEYGTVSDSNRQGLYYWRGAMGTDGTVVSGDYNATISRKSIQSEQLNPSDPLSVYGAFVNTNIITFTSGYDYTLIDKGMFVFMRNTSTNEEYYVGDVKAFNNTTVTLEKNALTWSDFGGGVLSAGYRIVFYNIRPYIHNHGRGLLTIEPGVLNLTGLSGPIGSEGEGHFAAAGLGDLNDTFNVYRASDNLLVAKLDSISTYNAAPDNETLKFEYGTFSGTYSGTPWSFQVRRGDFTVKMAADEYVIYINKPVSWHKDRTNKKFPGVYTATYSGYNWYGNGGELENQNRIVFSAPHNSESVDLSKDSADSIILPTNQQMRGMAGSSAGLLVFFEDKTYIIRGNYRLNFSVEELYPEGCLSAQSIVEFGGGVFWASKRGIMLFDGNSVRNLVQDNLGAYYTNSIKDFDAINNAVYAFVYKDYLFMHFTRFNSPFKPVRYEPIYAEGIDTTEAIQDYTAQDWDPDFQIDDFDPTNNVPIYWDYIRMYSSGRKGAYWELSVANESERLALSVLPGTVVFQEDTNQFWSWSGSAWTITQNNVNFDYWGLSVDNEAQRLALSVSEDTIVFQKDTNKFWRWTGTEWALAPEGQGFAYWGQVYDDYGMTFAIYLPTNATTTISNFDFRGFVTLDLFDGIRGLVGLNAVNPDAVTGVAPRIIDLDTLLDTNNTHEMSEDSVLSENIFKPLELYVKGPDMYLQTKHYTFGDPTLRKWFRQLFINLYQIDGGLRLDIVDNEDKDVIDIEKKKHKNWEIFTEDLYNWDVIQDVILPKVLSPKRSTWQNVEDIALTWYEFSDAQYERRKKQFSWRYPSMGFRLYQMNKFRPRNYQTAQRPHIVELDSWSIGFKPMRQTRV